jgi:hypothetical protein
MMEPEVIATQEESHNVSEEKKTHKKKRSKSKTGKKKKKSAKDHDDPPGFVDDIEMNLEPVPVENDPFAPRDGKALVWRNINMNLVRLYCQVLIAEFY